MHAPDSSSRRPHDPEERRPRSDPPHHPEPVAQVPPAGGEAEHGAADRPVQHGVPATPAELVAMQRLRDAQQSNGEARVEQALSQLRAEGLSVWESQQIALALLQQLEHYHQSVLAEMQDSPESTPAQVACWAIDGDRLMHCRRLLESITLI